MQHSEFVEGDVVICGTGQAGTIITMGTKICVLLRNDCLWYGHIGQIRKPQGQEDLDACPIDTDRFADR